MYHHFYELEDTLCLATNDNLTYADAPDNLYEPDAANDLEPDYLVDGLLHADDVEAPPPTALVAEIGDLLDYSRAYGELRQLSLVA